MSAKRAILLGNPNVGKSTLFHALIGTSAHDNLCAHIVEALDGRFSHHGQEIALVDLPGIYGLSAAPLEEKLARDQLLHQRPDVVINVLDRSNLDRNLYLTMQLIETGIPLVAVVNQNGSVNGNHHISADKLAKKLGVPVIQLALEKQTSMEALKQILLDCPKPSKPIHYDPSLEKEVSRLVLLLNSYTGLAKYPPRWLALQLLEGETSLPDGTLLPADLAQAVETSQQRIAELLGEQADLAISRQRYRAIHRITARTIAPDITAATLSDRIDRLVTHRFLGIPIFLAVMYLVFNLIRNVSAPFLAWLDGLFNGPLTHWSASLLKTLRSPDWLVSVITEGIIPSVGGVLVFLPSLFIMHFLLATLQQSGYLSRAAFVMDRFMSKVGLQGKSFIPMILGFGCNVPAIYATRSIEKRETRLLTGLLIPFMSCSARLPVYLIFGMAFFPQQANLVIFLLYLTGILVAAVVSLILSRVVFRGATLSILVLELPPYRKPKLGMIFKYALSQSIEFTKKVGNTFILFATVLWLLLNLPWGVTSPEDSLFGKLSSTVAPALAPAGFGTWEASGSLISGLVAKEMVVSALAQVYHVPHDEAPVETIPFWKDVANLGVGLGTATLEAGQALLETFTPGVRLFSRDLSLKQEDLALSQAIMGSFTPLSGAAFLVFVLLYVPCVGTISAQRHEFGWKWTLLSILLTLVVPWVMAVSVYQIGSIIGS